MMSALPPTLARWAVSHRWPEMVIVAGVLLGLAACGSSKPANYFTLVSDTEPATSRSGMGPAIEFLPIAVPQQMDQPQLMVRTSSAELKANYNARWAAGLGDEIQAALAQTLRQDLGITDVTGLGLGDVSEHWRIQIHIDRFELAQQGAARLSATWRLRRIDGEAPIRLCQTDLLQTPASATPADLVSAQQSMLRLLARDIGQTVLQPDSDTVTQHSECQISSESPAGTPPPPTAGVRTLL